jgi:triphosphoribosyl-dephospho-CoA synthase
LEVSAPKPGNVHRGADFEDLTYYDFVCSAVAIGPAFDAAAELRVGQTVLRAIQATHSFVSSNTNLGIVLLLAPLAAVPRSVSLGMEAVQSILGELGPADARDVYRAIQLARPGGIGQDKLYDVHGVAPANLLDAMQRAADRDLIAKQYVTAFREVFVQVVPWLTELTAGSLADRIIHAHVRLMAEHPDSLIARKCGLNVAREASDRASAVLDGGGPDDERYRRGLAELDFWLRSDHHRRNPGTTADLIAAGLFVVLRDELISPPFDVSTSMTSIE